jgi:shikimate kinase
MLIFLVGFMGCGKSYTARNLSSMLSIKQIDMDKAIEEQEGITVKEIFQQHGESYFRELERAYLKNLDPADDIIIATGGGAPCFFDNIGLMKQKGLVIWLNRSKDIALAQLLKGIDKRPLLAGMTIDQVDAFYSQKLEERRPFYQQAHICVGDASVEEVAMMIKAYRQKSIS